MAAGSHGTIVAPRSRRRARLRDNAFVVASRSDHHTDADHPPRRRATVTIPRPPLRLGFSADGCTLRVAGAMNGLLSASRGLRRRFVAHRPCARLPKVAAPSATRQSAPSGLVGLLCSARRSASPSRSSLPAPDDRTPALLKNKCVHNALEPVACGSLRPGPDAESVHRALRACPSGTGRLAPVVPAATSSRSSIDRRRDSQVSNLRHTCRTFVGNLAQNRRSSGYRGLPEYTIGC